MVKRLLLPVLAAGLLIAPCVALANGAKDIKTADTSMDQDPAITYNDPWENLNQPIFKFNVCFDRHVVKPVAETYHHVLPTDVRYAIDSELTNLSEPLNFIHGILQMNPKVAFTSFWRFMLNTTFGLGGLRDFAGQQGGLHHIDENLGKTFGVWGLPAGPYVVLPVFGPSSARDTTGKVGDWFLDPVGWEITTWASVGQAAVDGINTRDTQSGLINHLYYESLDPYAATRSTYRQHESFQDKKKTK